MSLDGGRNVFHLDAITCGTLYLQYKPLCLWCTLQSPWKKKGIEEMVETKGYQKPNQSIHQQKFTSSADETQQKERHRLKKCPTLIYFSASTAELQCND